MPIEIQTVPEAGFLNRALGYAHVFRRVLKRLDCDQAYDVFVAVIYLTGRAATNTLRMARQGLKGIGLKFTTISKAMCDEDAEAILRRIEKGKVQPCLLYWVSLMRNSERPDIIMKWKALAERFITSEERRNLVVVAVTFSELTGRLPIWREALKEWFVIESTLYKEWTREAELRGKREGEKLGRVEGEKLGRVEGEKRGKAEGQALALTIMLERSLGSALPADVASRIAGQENADTLSEWIGAAVGARSWDEVRAFMGIVAAPASTKKRSSKTSKNGHA